MSDVLRGLAVGVAFIGIVSGKVLEGIFLGYVLLMLIEAAFGENK